MSRLTVGERAESSGLKGRLHHEIQSFGDTGVGVEVDEREAGGHTFYTCYVEPFGHSDHDEIPHEINELFKSRIARAVADTILHDIEPELLHHDIKRLKPRYAAEDVAHVISLTMYEVRRHASGGDSERDVVLCRVVEYLHQDELLHLEGFVRFRLQAYRRELLDCLERAIKDFEAEREHQEFVHLLRYFLQGQQPTVDIVHILPEDTGSFRLVDGSGSAVDHDYLEGFVMDLAADGQVDQEDLLISTLVTLAPKHVQCHLPAENWNLTEIEEVFAGRIEHCSGCHLCYGYRASAGKPHPR